MHGRAIVRNRVCVFQLFDMHVVQCAALMYDVESGPHNKVTVVMTLLHNQSVRHAALYIRVATAAHHVLVSPALVLD